MCFDVNCSSVAVYYTLVVVILSHTGINKNGPKKEKIKGADAPSTLLLLFVQLLFACFLLFV